jgi:hypothetical protein
MMRVKVYFNIRNKKLSIQHKGIVIDRKESVCLENVEFLVSEKGRQRVLAEKVKNVHAYVVGDLIADCDFEHYIPVTYNPYKHNSFVVRDDLKEIKTANKVKIIKNKIMVER